MTAALHLAQEYDRPDADAAPDAVKFAPLLEVADRLGMERGHVARLCRDKWKPAGMALLASPPDGGSPTWYISRRVDVRLAPVLGDEYCQPDLSMFTISQREEAHQRAACVKAYRELRETDQRPQTQWLPCLVKQLQQRYPKLKVSERSLRRWYAQYQRPADILNLVSAKGGDRLRGASSEAWAYYQSIFLDERKPSVKLCWRRTRDEAKLKGWRWVSYAQCRRQLNDRIPLDTQMQFRYPRKWRWQHEPYIEQDPDTHAAGACWVGDHTQLDLLCAFGDRLVRPWLTTWMDWRTRRITGWALSVSPDSTTIMAALRMGLLDPMNFGEPGIVHIDNGRDYDSYVFHGQTKKMRKQRITEQVRVDETQFQGVLGMLGIEAHFSIAYNPNGKARAERWYGTLHDQFDKTFPTYTGANTADKPESLNRILKHRHKVPTFDHVRTRLADFIRGYNADADHSRHDMQGLSPDEAMDRWCERKTVMADESVLRLLLQHWAQPVSVGRNGIRVALHGKGFSYGQFSEALRIYKGTKKKVLVAYDPHDIRQVQVFDMKGRYVTMATMNNLGGMSTSDPIGKQQVGELIRSQRSYRKSRRELAVNGFHQYLSDAEQIAKMQADKPADKPERHRTLKIRTTPLDGQAKAVESDSFRQAAGAEHKEKHVFHYKRKECEDDTPLSLADILDFIPPMRGHDPYENDDCASAFDSIFGEDAGEFKPYKLGGGNN